MNLRKKAPSPAPTTGSHNMRSLQVTPVAWVLAGSVTVADAAGAALGYPQLLVVAAAGLLLLVSAIGFVVWRPRVRVGRTFHPKTVTAREAAVALLEVTNESRWPSAPLTVVDRLGPVDVPLPVRALAPGGSALVRYPLPTQRRGRIPLGPLRVVRSDPFGLLAAQQDHRAREVLWVHPRTWPMSVLPAGVVVDLEGPISETALQGSLTFSSLREYVAGDDRRQIHWRSSARLGTLMVRQHVDTNEPRATVVLDTRAGAWTDDSFEAGVEVAASVARALAMEGHPVLLHVVGEPAPSVREDGAHSVADRLAAAERLPASDPVALLSVLEQSVEGGSLVVVSGRLEASVEARVGAQRRRFAPVTVCNIDPDRPAGCHRRGGIIVVLGPTAPALVEAWNRMVRR